MPDREKAHDAMSGRILFIHHYDCEMHDTAWCHLGDLGFDRELVKPYAGDSLPADLTPYSGLVIYGGSQNVGETDRFPFLKDELALARNAIEADLPTLGLCLGGQILAAALGAWVGGRQPKECEFGIYPLTATDPEAGWIPTGFHGTQAHYEEFALPAGAVRLAASERYPNQAFKYGRNIFGLQFHPETTLDMFREWQDADWAMFDVRGSQNKQQQNRLAELHCDRQTRWFQDFLQVLFAADEATQTYGNADR